jgi:hypothetical protein
VRRTALYVAAWFAAGVAAVSLASAGVSMVGNQVTGSRPSPLSAADVEAELIADEPATTTTTTLTPPPTNPGTGTPTTGGTNPGPTATSAPTSVTPPPTTAPPAAPAVTRTYTLVGGTATLRFEAAGVTVVVASPNAGYSVDTESTHDNGVRVEFRSDEHRSRVEGWWDGGPRDEVDESDESDEADNADEADDAT